MQAIRNPELGSKIKQLREMVYPGVPIWKVAGMAGMAAPSWTELEKGRTNPTLATLVKVAAVMGCGIGDLTGDSPQKIEEVSRKDGNA